MANSQAPNKAFIIQHGNQGLNFTEETPLDLVSSECYGKLLTLFNFKIPFRCNYAVLTGRPALFSEVPSPGRKTQRYIKESEVITRARE